jgi:pilus assembly protein CpaC
MGDSFRFRHVATRMTLVLGLAAMMLLLPAARAADAPPLPQDLQLYAGQAAVYSAPGAVKRVAVGNGSLLEVKILGTREIVVIASGHGDTSLQFWLADGSQRSVPVHISEGSSEQATHAVQTMLGDVEGLTVSQVGGNVVVTGSNLGSGDVARIEAIKKIYPQILNFTSTNAVEMKPMVMMQVRIMEFDKNAMNEIGIKWDTQVQGPVGGLLHDFQTNPYFRVIPPDPGLANLAQYPTRIPGTPSYFGIATTIGSKINLAMQTGNAWELATPQLSARSGGSADFLVGGEVPIATSSALGQTTVEYKDYGIKLHLEPVVSESGDISAKIETELSKIDPSVRVGNYVAFITRRANTELNVHGGETIVISGLVDASASKTIDKMPGLGQIPIIGELFKSRAFRANRTELVIFVTPYVVDARSESNKKLIDRSEEMKNEFRKTAGADIVD